MSLSTTFKARKAHKAHHEGRIEEALKLYEECVNEDLKDVQILLGYSLLLLRLGEYTKARELLVKIQRYPMKPEQKISLYVNYAAAIYRLGEEDKAIEFLEKKHAKGESGLVYETLGYLYVEHGDFDKALEYNLKALEYDEEDAVTLDNLGQAYYRLKGDKETAKKYFDQAIELKPSQIDTRYFLALYDIEAGNTEKARETLEELLNARISPLNYATLERIQSQLNALGTGAAGALQN